MLVIALLLASSPAQPAATTGSFPGDLVAALGPFRPEDNAWVEYLVRSHGEQDVRVRFAVVGRQVDGMRTWIEVATAGSRAVPFAARVLLNRATGLLERASVMALGQAPIEVPLGQAGSAPIAAPRARVARRAATVSVPAGTFTTTELRLAELRLWRTDEVPLWGLVRAVDRRRTIELLRFGRSGARSVFQGNGSESANE